MKMQTFASVLIAGTLSVIAFSGCLTNKTPVITGPSTNSATGVITGPTTNEVTTVNEANLTLDASVLQLVGTPALIYALEKDPSARPIVLDIQVALTGAINGANTNVVSEINRLVGGDTALQASILPLIQGASSLEQSLLAKYGSVAGVQITQAILTADLNIVNAALKAVPAPVATPVP
jgi:hypothetical protein